MDVLMMRVTILLVICTSRNSASMPWATVTSRSPAARAGAANSGPATAPTMATSIAMDRRVFRIEPSLPRGGLRVRGGVDRTGSAVMVCPWKKGVKDAHLLDTAPPDDLHGYHLTTWAGHAPWVDMMNVVLPRKPPAVAR